MIFINKYIESIDREELTFTGKVAEEATMIKYTINKFLELFRDIYDADACYLYLNNGEMDLDEKKEILEERIKEMKEAYEKEIEKAQNEDLFKYNNNNLILPKELDKISEEDVKVLKFIDVSQKKKKNGGSYWNYSYRNRPQKYVIFTKLNNSKIIPENKIIFNEGITAYIYRTKKPLINTKKGIDRHRASASLNSQHGIKPTSVLSIGFPLLKEERSIGVLTIEFYDKNKEYNFNEHSNEFKQTLLYLPLFVQLIYSSKTQFKEGSYETLFGGMGLLNCLKNIHCSPENPINEKIYQDTIHLFYVLKRKEYVGYEEILGRIAGYANDVSKYLGLTSESKHFTDFLEKFKKHEELLLYGLNDFRDHFMHQFHVFVSGYIIINLIGFDIFRTQIENSLKAALGKSEEQLNISECNVLRVWFLVSFFHDHAYIFEKIDKELQNFFKNAFEQKFIVNFNWEQLLTKKSKFPTYLTNLQDFFSKQGDTNPDTLMRNYLDSIISNHDHGVLSALLLLNYFSNYESISPNFGNIKDDCLYAAFAISIHNQYENLMEKSTTRISFESFPIAFLLSYCDTAQSFGRIGKRQDYRSRLLDITLSEDGTIIYEIEFLDENGKKIPSPKTIEGWAKQAHNVFKSSKYLFEIKNYEVKDKDKKYGYYKKHIYTLSYGYYKQLSSQEPINTQLSSQEPINTQLSSQEPINTQLSSQEPINTQLSSQEPINTQLSKSNRHKVK